MSDRSKPAARFPSFIAAAAACLVLAPLPAAPAAARAPQLRLEEVGSDSTAFDVVATLIVGPTELIVWDAQYHVSDARRLADRIARTGRRLKAIVLSHPDHDHYFGAAVLVGRFPGTPVYLTAAGLAAFQAGEPGRQLAAERSRRPAETPDSLVTPQVLAARHLTVDGVDVELVPDLTGDAATPTNSYLWIPSLRAALAGDIAFNGVHPWLGASTEASRAAWRRSVQLIADRHPLVVVAGHKRDVAAPDSPAVLAFMDRYLTDFDAAVKNGPDGPAVAAAMLAKYPDLAVPGLLQFSARAAVGKSAPRPAAAGTTGPGADRLAGTWEGSYTTDGPAGPMTLVLTKGDPWTAANTLGNAPPLGPASGLMLAAGEVGWSQAFGEFELRFKAALTADGSRLEGTLEAVAGGVVEHRGRFVLSRKP